MTKNRDELPKEIEEALLDLEHQNHAQGWEGVNDDEVKRAGLEARAIIAKAIAQSQHQTIERVREKIKGIQSMFEHNLLGKKKAVCEQCREVVVDKTPCKASRYYVVWECIENDILQLLEEE